MLISTGHIFISGNHPTFNCVSPSASVEWLINGTRLEELSLTNMATEFSQISRQGILVFGNVSVEYNNTNIQCRATLSNGETVDSTLLVQGEREWLLCLWIYWLIVANVVRLKLFSPYCRFPSCCWFSDCYSYSNGLHHLPHLDTSLLPGYNWPWHQRLLCGCG